MRPIETTEILLSAFKNRSFAKLSIYMIRISYQLNQSKATQTPNANPLSHYSKEFPKDVVTVGRLPPCELIIQDDSVSSAHCEIRVVANVLFIVDLQSTNGTFVNEEMVSEKEITSADMIRIGSTILLINHQPDLTKKVPQPFDKAQRKNQRHHDAQRATAPATRQIALVENPAHTPLPVTPTKGRLQSRIDQYASDHPLLAFAAAISFFASLIPDVRYGAFDFCAEYLARLQGGSVTNAMITLVPVFELGLLGVLITTILLFAGFVIGGWSLRIFWRIRKPIFWVCSFSFAVYLLFEHTLTFAALLAGWFVLEVINRHFRNQRLILEELRRQRRD